MARLVARYPEAEWEAHFHDDRGFALINALAGIDAGVQYTNKTLLGIGERTGIPSMTALLFNPFVDARHRLIDGLPVRVVSAQRVGCRQAPHAGQ